MNLQVVAELARRETASCQPGRARMKVLDVAYLGVSQSRGVPLLGVPLGGFYSIWGIKNRGTLFRGPFRRTLFCLGYNPFGVPLSGFYSIWGIKKGYPYFGKYPFKLLQACSQLSERFIGGELFCSILSDPVGSKVICDPC